MTLGLFFSIASFTILLVVMFFVIEIYLDLTSTCSGEKENQQRNLEAGMPWNNTGAERTGPVEHDERLCPGMHQGDSGGTLFGKDYAKVKIDDDDHDHDDDDAVSWQII